MFSRLFAPKPILFAKAYAIALVLFLAMDTLWLSVLARDFYAEQFASLPIGALVLFPAILFYALYPIAIVWLCVIPSGGEKIAPIGALVRGVVLGMASYGAYNLTNAATVANWPLSITFVDILWGMLVTGTVSALVVRVYRALER